MQTQFTDSTVNLKSVNMFTPVTGTWYHLTCVGSNGNITVYLNGTTTYGPLAYVQSGITFNNASLGLATSSTIFPVTNADFDDFRVFNTALTATQVQAIYAAQGMPSRGVYSNIIGTSKTNFTGTPLFSQLSASAIASSVGAFSLRAVNGTTVKAVAVQAHPVVQWPPTVMTSNTTVISGQLYGNGTYIASSSNGCVVNQNQEFRAFDNDPNTYYEQNYPTGVSYNDAGNLINPTLTQTTVSGAIVQGEWLQINLPTPVILRSYTIVPRLLNVLRCPRIFWIAGSPDGSTWSNVHFQTGITGYTNPSGITFTPGSNTAAYSYYRLIVNAIGSGGGNRPLNIASWNIYGDAPSYATGSATDFYADRLGNLLTQPVIGQSLANWIGGATGYVTTWYDQSGRGNHATQSTAANQPVIQKATKGPGYSCLFSGSQRLALGSNAFINNTPYTLQIVERRNVNSNVAGAGYFGWGGSESTPTSNISHIGYRAWSLSYPLAETSLWTSQYADDKSYTNAVIKFTSPLTENVAYTWHTHDLNHTARIYTWRGGVLYPSFSTNIGTFLNYLRPTAINTYYIGWSSMAYYIGEIYEVLVFTNSLYDLDTTGGIITQIYNNQFSYTGT
jgi:hypothetical protein